MIMLAVGFAGGLVVGWVARKYWTNIKDFFS